LDYEWVLTPAAEEPAVAAEVPERADKTKRKRKKAE
jgi:hypothetical protein